MQTHVIRENDVRSATHRRARVVRRARIQFGQQKARLRAVLIAINQTRHGESSGDYLFRLRLGRREQVFERHVLWLILIVRLSPLRDRHTVENDNTEVSVEDQDFVRGDRAHVQQYGLGRTVEGVRRQRGLNHHQRIEDVFTHQNHAEIRRLVGRIVEHLHELRSSQVEHELRVNAKLRHELKRMRIVLSVIAKALAQLDELAIEPSRRRGAIRFFLSLHLPRQLPSDEHGCGFLIEPGGDVVQILSFGPTTTRRDDAHARLAAGERVRAQELQVKLLRLLPLHGHRLLIFPTRIRNVKVHRQRRFVRERAKLPRRRSAAADGRVARRAWQTFSIERSAWSDHPRCPHVAARDYFELSVVRDSQSTLSVWGEKFLKRRLEHGVRKRLSQHDVPASLFHANFHLRQSDLIERAREHVQHVSIRAQVDRHLFVILFGLVIKRRRALDYVLVRSHRLLHIFRHDRSTSIRSRAAGE